MANLPQLAVVEYCPDEVCSAPVGAEHTMDCSVAVCLTTGHQRVLHNDDYPIPAAPAHDLPLDVHICGADTWTGRPRGAVEAAAHGLFVRAATPADAPLTGWIPCEPGEPGAVPDLNRVVRDGRWNPIRQTWELPEEATRRG